MSDRAVLAPGLPVVRRDDDQRVLASVALGGVREKAVERRVDVRERLVVPRDEVLAVTRAERDAARAVHLPEQRVEERAGRTRRAARSNEPAQGGGTRTRSCASK